MGNLKRKFWVCALSVFWTIFSLAPLLNADYLDPSTYQDTETFNSNWIYSGQVSWEHTLPADFTPLSADISLILKVVFYSDIGALDLFSSNTNVFDYGSPYTAPSKPGYVGDLYIPWFPQFLWILTGKQFLSPLKITRLTGLPMTGTYILHSLARSIFFQLDIRLGSISNRQP